MKSPDRREFLLAASGLALGAKMQNRPVRRSLGEGGSYELEPVAAGKSLKAPDGRAVLTYLTSKPEGSNLRANSACCFHPLNTPSGERLTDLAPGDHVHHRGIFLAWHSMEFRWPGDFSKLGPLGPPTGSTSARADFWGWGQFAPTDRPRDPNRSLQIGQSTRHVRNSRDPERLDDRRTESDGRADDRRLAANQWRQRSRPDLSADPRWPD